MHLLLPKTNMKLILIAGLPGSGKTTYAKNLAEDLVRQNKPHALTSDPMDITVFKSDFEKIQHDPEAIWIIESPYLCRKHDQESLINYIRQNIVDDIEAIEWFMFENNAPQCIENSNNRKDARDVLATINLFSRDYHFPTDSTIIPVWTPQPSTTNLGL